MRRSLVLTLGALLAAGLARAGVPAGEPANAAVEVALRSEAHLEGAFVRVADVAELAGGGAEARSRVASVYLGRAPESAASRKLTARFVAARLADDGFGPKAVRVTGAPAVLVKKADGSANESASPSAERVAPEADATGRLDHARLLTCAVSFLASRLACAPERLRVELVGARVKNGAIPPAAAGLTYAVQPVGRRLLVGRVRLVADAFLRGERVAEVAMDLDVTRFTRVVLLTRPVRRGQRLTSEMLRAAVLDVRGAGEYVADPEMAAGQVVKRSLDAGTALELGMIEAPVLVRRNRPVRLVVVRANLRLTERLVAREEGALGEVIQVERPGTRQRFFVCVSGDGTVTIPEGGF